LAGQIVTQGVSDEFVERQPAVAVQWRSDSAEALAQLALAQLASRGPNHAAALARRSLQIDPLNTAALSAVGLTLDRVGQSDQANRAMTVAGARGWRDPVTQIWLMQHRLATGDYVQGFARADALLRRAPGPRPFLFGVVAAAAENPAAMPPLVERLKADPDWRSAFLTYLDSADGARAETEIYELLHALSRGPAPPSDDEVSGYLMRLAQEGRFADARQAWRSLSRSAPPGDTPIYDGDFETPRASTPFDWSLNDGVGWTATVADAPGRGHGRALRLDYDGTSPPHPLGELLTLAPGAYRLTGQVYAERPDAPGQLHWLVLCRGRADRLTRTQTNTVHAGEWNGFGTTFAVPATGCPTQVLELTADPADEPNEVTVWFDNIAVAAVTQAGASANSAADSH
jgi:tetratricopeptide (TPR) repeat protein